MSKEEQHAVIVAINETETVLQKLFLTYKGNNTFLIITLKNILNDVIDNIKPIEKLVELNREDAIRWLEKYAPSGSVKKFEEMLERNKQDLNKGQMPVRLGGLLREKVDSVCEEFNLTVNGVIVAIVARHIEDYRQFLRDNGTISSHRSFLTNDSKKK